MPNRANPKYDEGAAQALTVEELSALPLDDLIAIQDRHLDAADRVVRQRNEVIGKILWYRRLISRGGV